MFDYSNIFTNIDPTLPNTFPDTKAINVTAPAAADGTEFIAAWMNDQMGARQALIDHVGFTPNSVTESATNSQFLEAIKSFMPIGTVIAWHGQTDISNFGRFIQLEGQTVLISDYEELVENTYIQDVNNSNLLRPAYYKSSDAGGAVRDTAGLYFTLPDTRGYVLRGHDPSGSVDPDGATRFFPDTQTDAMVSHEHWVTDTDAGINYLTYIGISYQAGGSPATFYGRQSTYDNVQTTGPIGVDTDSENRMVNYQAKFAVRY